MEHITQKEYTLIKTSLTMRDGRYSFGGTEVVLTSFDKEVMEAQIKRRAAMGPDFARNIMRNDVEIHCSYDRENNEKFSAWAELKTEEVDTGKATALTFYEEWKVFTNDVLITEETKNEIGRICRDEEIREDLQNTLIGLREAGESDWLPSWKYEYLYHNAKAMKSLIARYWNYSSGEVPENATLYNTIRDGAAEISLNDTVVKALWNIFGEIGLDDNGEVITEDFMDFEAWETSREDIWHWFDKHYSKGVGILMSEDEGEEVEA